MLEALYTEILNQARLAAVPVATEYIAVLAPWRAAVQLSFAVSLDTRIQGQTLDERLKSYYLQRNIDVRESVAWMKRRGVPAIFTFDVYTSVTYSPDTPFSVANILPWNDRFTISLNPYDQDDVTFFTDSTSFNPSAHTICQGLIAAPKEGFTMSVSHNTTPQRMQYDSDSDTSDPESDDGYSSMRAACSDIGYTFN